MSLWFSYQHLFEQTLLWVTDIKEWGYHSISNCCPESSAMIQTECLLQLNFNYYSYKLYPQIEGTQLLISKILAVHIVTSFHRVHTDWKREENNNFTWKSLPNATSARWSRSTWRVINQVDRIVPWDDVVKITPYLCDLSSARPRKCSLSLITRKPASKTQLRDSLHNIWPLFLKTLKDIKNKNSLGNCHSQEEFRETDK